MLTPPVYISSFIKITFLMLKYMHLGYSYIVSFAILQKISEHIIIWLWCQTWSFAFLNKKSLF